MKTDPIVEVISKYGEKYKHKLKKETDDTNEVERKLNEWIKKVL